MNSNDVKMIRMNATGTGSVQVPKAIRAPLAARRNFTSDVKLDEVARALEAKAIIEKEKAATEKARFLQMAARRVVPVDGIKRVFDHIYYDGVKFCVPVEGRDDMAVVVKSKSDAVACAIVDSMYLVINKGKKLLSVHLRTGHLPWESDIPGAVQTGHPAYPTIMGVEAKAKNDLVMIRCRWKNGGAEHTLEMDVDTYDGGGGRIDFGDIVIIHRETDANGIEREYYGMCL